jgi:hypothetical protein
MGSNYREYVINMLKSLLTIMGLWVSKATQSLFLILGSESHNKKRTTNNATIIGCNTFTPFACAIAPTIKGNTAPPVPPKAVANPIALTCKCTGSSFVLITIPAGNKGPKKKPRNATATAETTN